MKQRIQGVRAGTQSTVGVSETVAGVAYGLRSGDSVANTMWVVPLSVNGFQSDNQSFSGTGAGYFLPAFYLRQWVEWAVRSIEFRSCFRR